MNQLFCLQHRGDRYLGHSSRHIQVPVPATSPFLLAKIQKNYKL